MAGLLEVERFHQTLKQYLDKQPAAKTRHELQQQVDTFIDYYNHVRPHRAVGRKPPILTFMARDKARPAGKAVDIGAQMRVRADRVDKAGQVTLRHRTTLYKIMVGKHHARQRVKLLIDGLNIRVVDRHGHLLRKLVLDPTKIYQGTGDPPGPPKGKYAGRNFRNPSGML